MVILDTTTKVLIIGSGLSGPALAQILRKANVQFEIFERDTGKRPQGWAIGLDQCLGPLRSLLPADLDNLATSSPNYVRQKEDTFTVMDGPTNAVLGVINGKIAHSETQSFLANRNKCRQILTKHVNIQYGKRLISFEEDNKGVTVFFEDGSIAHGDILVGADGANSPVRSQLLNGFKADTSPFIMFFGNVVLPKPQYEVVLKHSTNGIIIGGPNIKGYLFLLDYVENDSAEFNWNISWRADNYEEQYAKWQSGSPEDQLDMLTQLLNGWPPEVVQSISQTKAPDVQIPPMRLFETVLPQEGLPRGRVTLIGDAAHSMAPFRGMGANTALLDSCDLGKALIEGIKNNADLESALKDYEGIMLPRGREKVLESRSTGEAMDSEGLAGGRLPPP